MTLRARESAGPEPHERSPVDKEEVAGSRAIPWTVAGIIVLESVYVWWIASTGFFFQDDFIDFQEARQLGAGWRLLEQPIFGHFVPGYNLVNYLISSSTPYHWSVIEIADVVMFAVMLGLLYRLLVILFGATWVIVPLVAVAGASFSLVPSLVWWASGLQQLVSIPATLLLVIFHVRYLETGRFRFALLGGISLAVALAFYDGALVSALFVVLFTALICPSAPGIRGWGRALLACWPAWICYGIPVGLDLGWRLSHATLYATPPLPTPIELLQFASLSWTQTFVPLTFGLDSWLLGSHSERALAGTIGQIIVITLVILTIVRRRDAWRPWVLFGVVFLAMTCLVGLTRVSAFGPGDASDVRYFSLSVYFLAIAVGLALRPARLRPFYSAWTSTRTMPVARSDDRPARHSRPLHRRPVFWLSAAPALCAIVVLYAVALNFDRSRDSTVQGDYASRTFFTTYSSSWAHAESEGNHPYVWDTEVDPIIVADAFYPDDTTAITVGALNPDVRFDAWGGTGYVVRPDGSVVRAVAVTQATAVLPGDAGVCVESADKPAGMVLQLSRALGSQRWFGVVSYSSRTGAIATLSGGSSMAIPKGSGTAITTFPPGPMSSVALTLGAHRNLCVTEFKIVLPEPEPEPVGSGAPTARPLHAPQPPHSRT
jgi:hypothetical protein